MFEKISEFTNKSSQIRVVLLLDKTDYKIKLDRYTVVENDATGEKMTFGKYAKEFVIKKDDHGIFINNEKLSYPIKIYSNDNRLISINDKKYFGVLKIIPDNNEIRIINYVPTETYLMSVLLSEMPLSFNIEALKAQVVIARTYACLFKNKYEKRRDYDVDNTTNYQVYKGYNVNLDARYIKKIETAIKETKGEIVVYNDKPILAYFHANSGGRLTSGRDYFGEHSDFPYLVAKDDPYSLNMKGSKWEYKIGINDFLGFFGYKYKEADSMHDKITTEDILSLLYFNGIDKQLFLMFDEYYTDKMDEYYIALSKDNFTYYDNEFVERMTLKDNVFYAKDIRGKIGNSIFKSIKFKINIDYDSKTITFDGVGYGHGVGLSQWGAQGMAEKGFNYKDIIAFYYPNTTLVKLLDEDINF
jgi:stage II sporulation protein D